ncbi:restriction endonuclease subunit S [Mesoflavibacter sp. SCSIO 43206]|uniref:restriction endonuclease subunit S n=1 Tax=Mesoflavibacter sp. SCSIO 43206 TaxID=2779362 RepID=UPI001CA839A2|nr:restriction endonuclease subunit S [Mesoflavibacter sp. SCSIO 43206]UAB74312.1 restriction endonuclease subunit S [Mesoflavibacter sp. SCSIO 43206]
MKEDCEINYKDAVFKISTTKQKLKQKEYLQKGKIPVIDQGQELIGGFTNDKEKILDCKLPVVVFGDHTKNVKLINFPFAPGADGTKVLQPKKGILPKYLSYVTEVLVFKIKDNGYARHYQHIEKEDFPLVSIPEQQANVKKIEELFSSLDSGIADLKKAQDQLAVYRQAVLKKAFEGIKEFKPLKECGEWKGGGTPNRQIKEYWENGKIPWVSSRDVKTKEIHDTERHITEIAIPNSSTKWIEENSLLFVMRSGILRRIFPIAIAKTKLCVNQDIQTVSLDANWNTEYVYWFLQGNESDIRHSCSKDGTTVESIDANSLKAYLVPFCSLKQQHQIVQEIESRLSVCDKVEKDIANSLEKAQALRQSILKKAYEGTLLNEEELAACKQHKDYEPASVLLERIKAEKKSK